MKKRTWKLAIPIAAILLLTAAVIFITATPKRDWVLKVDGSVVPEAEFLLLFRENQTEYETALRNAHKIPDGQTVSAWFGDTAAYRRALLDENIRCITALRVEQTLAQTYGVIPEFTYPSFLKDLEAENRSREEKLAKGEPVYGLQSFSAAQYYSYFMSNLALELKRALPAERLDVTEEDIAAHYQRLPYFANLEGERMNYTLYDVTAAQTFPPEIQAELYRAVTATMEEGTYLAVSAEGLAFPPEPQSFTDEALRTFVRQSFDGEFLLSLEQGEITEPFSLGEKIYLAQYHGFQKAETLQENEKDVFRAQLEQQAYEALITQTAETAKVQRNQPLLDALATSETLP